MFRNRKVRLSDLENQHDDILSTVECMITCAVSAAKASAIDKAVNKVKESGFDKEYLLRLADKIDELEIKIGENPSTKKTISFTQWYPANFFKLSDLMDKPKTSYTIQEQLEQIREHLGLKLEPVQEELKLVKTSKPVKKAVAKKPVGKKK